MLYVARDGAGDITAICNNPTTAENLRALIDDSIEEVPTAGAAEDYVFTINGKAGSQHIANSEAEVVDFITSTPGIQFKKNSPLACRRMKPRQPYIIGWTMATWTLLSWKENPT